MPLQEELARAQEVLFNQGILMHLFVGKWTANKKLRQRDILAEGINPELIYLGHKKLLPREAQQRLQQIEGRARSYLDAHSLDFPIGKAKYVYYRSLPQVVERLRRYKEDWDQAVDDLVEGYPEFQVQQLERLDAQNHALADQEFTKVPSGYLRQEKMAELRTWEEEQKRINRNLYPNVDTLKRRYAFEWRLFRVNAMDGVQMMAQLQQDELVHAQQQIRADYANWVRQASAELHRELGEACAQAQRILEANGRISARSLKPLFDAFETFQAVSFSEGSEFQRSIDRIRQLYAARGTDLQETAAAVNESPEELRRLLGTLSSLAVDRVAEEAGIRAVQAGAFARLLEV